MQLLINTTSPYARLARIALIEKGLDIAPTLVDPWADDRRLRRANAATRVPTLVLDDGTPLTESLLIVQWLETARPAPRWPGLISHGPLAAGVLSRAGIALGAIDAAVHTIITRKVTAPVLFDTTKVGLRRRRTMVEGLQRLEALASQIAGPAPGAQTPLLDAICATVLFDYVQLRFGGQPWVPATPRLQALAEALRKRHAFASSMPKVG
ncbi:glutathione S-transferase family protein [Ottowia sp.]|uniref:glutathione S-transferase family protein n=1 Tax=Ottowia sp. TaxID=1898956 RepID=UPI002608A506|nr:glutathione S-transferase family protein [Ottowia sp.]